MDETLNSVDAELNPVVEDSQEVTTGEGESAVVAEQPVTEAPVAPKEQTREDNAQYKALRLQEKQDAVDKEYADLAESSGWTKLDGSPIKTKADFLSTQSAIKQRDDLIMQGKTEREALLEIELNERKQRDAENETQAQEKARLAKESSDFLQAFKEANGRDFTVADKDELEKAGVFQIAADEGIPLKYAYDHFFASQQREKAKAIEVGKKTQEVNASNATTTTGSLTGGGQPDNSVLTDEVINGMTDKQRMARWPEIKKFYNMK